MYKKNLLSRILWAVFVVFATQTTVFAEPTNLGLEKKNLVEYHDSGAYMAEIQTVANNASQYITHEALVNKTSANPKKLAIVLDIDETCLSNYSNMITIDFANLPDKILEQISAANEPAIQPMLDLYQKALHNNIAVFFVTGRDQSLEKATIQNLHTAGFENWSGLTLRHGQIPTIEYKTKARANIAKQGYTIIASIGDQDSDLTGGYALQTFKLPNPYYYLP